MSFTADGFGIAAQVNIKPCSFDFQLLKHLGSMLNNPNEITIITYALPHMQEYLQGIFDIRSKDVNIICNSKYADDARALKEKYSREDDSRSAGTGVDQQHEPRDYPQRGRYCRH